MMPNQSEEKFLQLISEEINFPNEQGITPLMWAASDKDRIRNMNALLDAKAQIDLQDKNGYTALIHAAKAGNMECIRQLIEAKADLNKQTNYKEADTALTWALYNGHTECAKLLIEAGANSELPSDHTPWDYAIEKENLEVIHLLLSCGALSTNPSKLEIFLRSQDKNDENTYAGFYILCEQQKILREEKNTHPKFLLDDKKYNEAKSYLSSLPIPKEIGRILAAKVISTIDNLHTIHHFPFVISKMISEYDNHYHLLFKPFLKKNVEEEKKNDVESKQSRCLVM